MCLSICAACKGNNICATVPKSVTGSLYKNHVLTANACMGACDVWDVAGTSTGAILAAYLATKGGNCSASILESQNRHYQDQIAQFKAVRDKASQVAGVALDRGNNIDAGVRLAQTLFPLAVVLSGSLVRCSWLCAICMHGTSQLTGGRMCHLLTG